MQLINLTPHDITVFSPAGVKVFPPSGSLCRVRALQEPAGTLGGIPVYKSAYGLVEGLPEACEGVCYLTSSLILKALVDAGVSRPDVLAPGTGPQDGPIRNSDGRIVGVTRLIRAA